MSQTLKFLVGKEKDGELSDNKSCFFTKNNVLFLINCGEGIVTALKRSGIMKNIKEVYIIVTHSSKQHLYDLKKFITVLKNNKITPKVVDSISLDKDLLKKMKIAKEDIELVEPLRDNCNWVNFLVTPHKDKSFSCPVELKFDGKKILYAGDCGTIPFSIENYDEYYFDFADKTNEYALDIEKIKKLVKKNKIKRNQLWLVHLNNMHALQIAEKVGMNVAEEKQKIQEIHKKQIAVKKQEQENKKESEK